MKRALNWTAHEISFWLAYFLTWCEMKGHYVDSYLFSQQGNLYMAADAECRFYDCQRRLQHMLINRRYA
jgi:hypothetical protein